jgi:hypothetical protein
MDKSFTEFSVFCGSRNPYKVIKNNAAKSTPLLSAGFYSLKAQNQRRPL